MTSADTGADTHTGTALYGELELAPDPDPLATAARLTADPAFAQHVLYECDGEYSLAGGVLAELRISASRARMTLGGDTTVLKARSTRSTRSTRLYPWCVRDPAASAAPMIPASLAISAGTMCARRLR